MKELIAEYDCFISAESSNNLQLINHNRINNYNDIKIINAQYKHRIPDLQMVVEHKGYESNCKSSFESTETKLFTEVDDLNKTKCNFIVYFRGNEAHFVPLTRPILSSFITNNTVPELDKKHVKEKSKADYNPIAETRKSLETFHELSKNREFTFINDAEKIRQPWVPVNVQSDNNMISESRQSVLLCYKREELKYFNEPNARASIKRKLKKDNFNNLKERNNSLTRNSISVSSLETEILNILIEYKVIKFSKLIELIRDRHQVDMHLLSEEIVLNYLETIALIIRGHWVIKSEVYYKICPRDGKTHVENLCLARDYILCLFYEGMDVTAKSVQSDTKVTSETATEILSQLSERINDSKNGLWKFPEHDFEFINNNKKINDKQIKIMEQKCEEIRRKLKIQNSAGKSDESDQKLMRMDNNRRLRTYSSQGNSPNSKKRNKTIDELTVCSPKRIRQNSAPTKQKHSQEESDSIDGDLETRDNSVLEDIPEDSFVGIDNSVEDISENSKNIIPRVQVDCVPQQFAQIKEEPYMSCHDSPDCDDMGEVDINPYIKPESSKFFSDQEYNTQQNSLNAPRPSDAIDGESLGNFSTDILNDINQFVETQLIGQQILPIKDLSEMYFKDHFSKLKCHDIRKWNGVDEDVLIDKISSSITNILDELSAERIDITWPQIKTALPEQTIYFYSKDSQTNERAFFTVIVHLLKMNGQFVISDLKKEIAGNMELKMSLTANDNMLRDRLKKYCHFVHRKYFLKHTISMKK